jgi:hypothetical protein
MRIDCQQFALEIPGSQANFPQGNLQLHGSIDGQFSQQVMDGLIGGYERQSIGQFESCTLV